MELHRIQLPWKQGCVGVSFNFSRVCAANLVHRILYKTLLKFEKSVKSILFLYDKYGGWERTY